MSIKKCFILPHPSQELTWARQLFCVLTLSWIYSFIHQFVLFHFHRNLPFHSPSLYSLLTEGFHITLIVRWMTKWMSRLVNSYINYSFLHFKKIEWYLSCWNCLSILEWRKQVILSQVLHCTVSFPDPQWKDWIYFHFSKNTALSFWPNHIQCFESAWTLKYCLL